MDTYNLIYIYIDITYANVHAHLKSTFTEQPSVFTKSECVVGKLASIASTSEWFPTCSIIWNAMGEVELPTWAESELPNVHLENAENDIAIY